MERDHSDLTMRAAFPAFLLLDLIASVIGEDYKLWLPNFSSYLMCLNKRVTFP